MHLKKLLIVAILFLLAPGLLRATDCNGNCTFIRGDANCSGNVSLVDLNYIGYGGYTNADAADVTDDGVVNYNDYAYLFQYLYQGGPAPACPFPTAGKDCTPDNLETDCSPPTSRQTGVIPDAGVTATLTTTNSLKAWDSKTVTMTGSPNTTIAVECKNYSACDHSASIAKLQVTDIDITDTTGFQRKRLQHGVQKVAGIIDIFPIFDHGEVCQASACNGYNHLQVSWIDSTVEFVVKPSSGGSPTTITKQISDLLQFEYERLGPGYGSCYIVDNDDWAQSAQLVWDLTSDLAAIPSSDAEVWKLDSIKIPTMRFNFQHEGWADIAGTEEIDCDIEAYYYYWWCTCP